MKIENLNGFQSIDECIAYVSVSAMGSNVCNAKLTLFLEFTCGKQHITGLPTPF
jgi:hypothetical protein